MAKSCLRLPGSFSRNKQTTSHIPEKPNLEHYPNGVRKEISQKFFQDAVQITVLQMLQSFLLFTEQKIIGSK